MIRLKEYKQKQRLSLFPKLMIVCCYSAAGKVYYFIRLHSKLRNYFVIYYNINNIVVESVK